MVEAVIGRFMTEKGTCPMYCADEEVAPTRNELPAAGAAMGIEV
jgi:hypothetical protein